MNKPKFIISKSKVLEQYNKLIDLSDIISYSSKTNPIISSILEKETNCMFSIHLTNELKNIENKSRIYFLAQAWNEKTIKQLINQKIKNFIIDNEADLNILLKYLNTSNKKINLFLRMKLKENTIKTEKYFVFGINSDRINQLVPELKQNPNINEIGIHFHRKTQNIAEWSLQREIENTLSKETLNTITHLNIGGGLPSIYANTNEKVFYGIFEKIKQLKSYLNKKNIKLIIEPGRFIAAPSCKLKTTITRIYENNIIINASVYNSDMDALIVPVKLLIEGELESGTAYAIKGMTPCSLDLFRYKVYLDNPKEGDTITFLNAGAYNFTSDFCDLDKIETKIID